MTSVANLFRSLFVLSALLLTATPAMAQDDSTSTIAATQAETYGYGRMGLGVGLGLAVVGIGVGIGLIGGNAVGAIARQPEASGNIQTNMIIAAALIEGAGLFAILILGFILA
jgi:F-type H+-transporting ATPase subunit c